MEKAISTNMSLFSRKSTISISLLTGKIDNYVKKYYSPEKLNVYYLSLREKLFEKRFLPPEHRMCLCGKDRA
jgi:hypothetical protein